jgi:hypothetical protein
MKTLTIIWNRNCIYEYMELFLYFLLEGNTIQGFQLDWKRCNRSTQNVNDFKSEEGGCMDALPINPLSPFAVIGTGSLSGQVVCKRYLEQANQFRCLYLNRPFRAYTG